MKLTNKKLFSYIFIIIIFHFSYISSLTNTFNFQTLKNKQNNPMFTYIAGVMEGLRSTSTRWVPCMHPKLAKNMSETEAKRYDQKIEFHTGLNTILKQIIANIPPVIQSFCQNKKEVIPALTDIMNKTPSTELKKKSFIQFNNKQKIDSSISKFLESNGPLLAALKDYLIKLFTSKNWEKISITLTCSHDKGKVKENIQTIVHTSVKKISEIIALTKQGGNEVNKNMSDLIVKFICNWKDFDSYGKLIEIGVEKLDKKIFKFKIFGHALGQLLLSLTHI